MNDNDYTTNELFNGNCHALDNQRTTHDLFYGEVSSKKHFYEVELSVARSFVTVYVLVSDTDYDHCEIESQTTFTSVEKIDQALKISLVKDFSDDEDNQSIYFRASEFEARTLLS